MCTRSWRVARAEILATWDHTWCFGIGFSHRQPPTNCLNSPCFANIQTSAGKGLLARALPFSTPGASSPSSLLFLSLSQPFPQAWSCLDFSDKIDVGSWHLRICQPLLRGWLCSSSLMMTGRDCAWQSSERYEKFYHLCARSTYLSFWLTNLESEWKIRWGKHKKDIVGGKENFLSVSIIINKFKRT